MLDSKGITTRDVFGWALGGALACGITHLATLPLDFAKIHNQLNGADKHISAFDGTYSFADHFTGFKLTVIGYFIQGVFKFGLYEFLKVFAAFRIDMSKHYKKILVFIVASCLAETVADIGLLPFENAKIMVQKKFFEDVRSPVGEFACLTDFLGQSGQWLGAFVMLWGRQILSTCSKFLFFELIMIQVDKLLVKMRGINFSTKLFGARVLVSGFFAGFLSALASQPFDALLTNKFKGAAATPLTSIEDYYSGWWPRAIQFGVIGGTQWFIFKYVSRAVRGGKQ